MQAGKPSTKQSTTRARVGLILRLVPLCLLAGVLWREKPWAVRVSPNAPWAVTASIVINFLVFLPIKAARWRLALVAPPPFRQVLAATVEGLLANAAIGFGSGDLVRAARLRRQEGQLAVDYACTWAERGAEALAFAVLIFVAGFTTRLGRTALAVSGATIAGYAVLLAGGRFLVPRLGRWPRVQGALAAGLAASTPRRVAAMAALSVVGWGSEMVMLALFQSAFHLPVSYTTALLTLIGINAAIAIPTLPGNFGTFEAGAVMALVSCGAARDVAVSYALAYHLTHVVPVAVVATAVYLVRGDSSTRNPGRVPNLPR